MSERKSCFASRKKLKLFVPALALLLLFFALSGSTAAQPGDTGFETIELPSGALEAPAFVPPKQANVTHPKLDTALAELVAAADTGEIQTVAQSRAISVDDNRVQVQMDVDVAHIPQLQAAISSVGGTMTGAIAEKGIVQAWVPVTSLTTIAARSEVRAIQRPAEVQLFEPHLSGNYTTEALSAINADEWHEAGYTGAGIKIGIIDGGFQGYSGLLGSDLPASVTVKNFVDGESDLQVDGTTPHGTACAEIIYDVAPDAQLYLVKIATLVDLIEAVDYLRGQNVDLISTSLGFYNVSPGDGTGVLADTVQQARNDGILWVTAAGNNRELHWGGQYRDTDNNKSHEFASGQEINHFGPDSGSAFILPAGRVISGYLRWDDWDAIEHNFALVLYRWNGNIWEIVTAVSHSGTRPSIRLQYQVPESGAYAFSIYKYSGDNQVNLEFFTPQSAQRLEVLFRARSLANLADAPAAMTVAALDSDSPYPQESYSSEGPTNGPGGTASGGFTKPDISGYANVDTSSYGTTQQFNGTSAATPHIAGAAALVRGGHSGFSPLQIQSFLESRATDKGISGLDNVFGYGRLTLGGPPLTLVDLPAQILEKNTSHENVVDLWQYTYDNYSDSTQMFTITNSPAISAGVSLDSNRYIDINPQNGWTGTTDVTIQAKNPANETVSDTFSVHIVDQVWRSYLPVIKNRE